MPYSNPKQATAAFLDIKRRQGLGKAKAFGRKHADALSKAAKMRGKKPYRSRKARGK